MHTHLWHTHLCTQYTLVLFWVKWALLSQCGLDHMHLCMTHMHLWYNWWNQYQFHPKQHKCVCCAQERKRSHILVLSLRLCCYIFVACIWRGSLISSIAESKKILSKGKFVRLSSLHFVSGNVTGSVSESVRQSVSEWMNEWVSQVGQSCTLQESANMVTQKFAVMASPHPNNNGSTNPHIACYQHENV